MKTVTVIIAAAGAAAALATTACQPTDSASASNSSSKTSTTSKSSSKASETKGKLFQHAEDVKINSCRRDDAGFLSANVTVTNKSSKASDYFVTVAFESPSGAEKYGDGTAMVMSLQPGQVARDEANALKEHAGSFKCVLSDVQRTAAI